MRTFRQIDRGRRGVALVYTICIMAAALGICSFAVDYGRVQLGKTQLRQACDAAALAAAAECGSITKVQDNAAQYAAANVCDGSSIAIDKVNDVDFLSWDTTSRTYAVLTGNARTQANAVRVSCSRTGANGIPLMFGSLIGIPRCNIHASAIAALAPGGYGLVGIDSISLKGNAAASYWSSTGVIGGNAGNVASNGNVTSSGSSTIQGTVWTTSSGNVSGVTANAVRTLTKPLSYPNGSSGANNASNNNNAFLPNGMMNASSLSVGNNKSYTVPGGTYYVNNFSVAASGSIQFTGPVTIYCYGTFSMSGGATTAGNVPGNLTIVMIPNPNNGNAPGSLTIGSNASLYANIYAPQSPIILSGTGAIYGAVLGKSVTMTGTSNIYYDLSLSGSAGGVQLVR